METQFDLVALRAKVDTGEIIEVVAENPFLLGDIFDRFANSVALVTQLPDELNELLAKVADIDARSSTEIIENVPKLVIQNDADRTFWVDENLPRILGWQKHADEVRSELKRPFLDGGKQVDDLFRDALALLSTIVRRIKDADNAYRKQIEKEQAEANAREQERQRQERVTTTLHQAAKLESQGEPEKAQALLTRAAETPLAPVTTAGPPLRKLQNSSVTKRWKFEVTDPNLVPRDFCVPSDALIKARVNTFGDKADIPGVRVWRDDDLATRAIRPVRGNRE